jgi:hypothetical protein
MSVEKRWKRVSITSGTIDRLFQKEGFDEIYYMGPEFFEGSIEEVIERINNLKKILERDGYRNIKIDVDSYYENLDISVTAERLETEKEAEKRVKLAKQKKEREKKKKVEREAKERAELARLKKKYEGKS